MNYNLYVEISRYERWLKEHTGGCSSKPDYKYKAFILDKRLDRSINKIGYAMYNHMLDDLFDCVTLNILDRNTLDHWFYDIIQKYGVCSVMESIRINNARYHRLKRLRDRVESIISYESYFLTLTFNNNCLQRTSAKTRREYVTRYLKSLSTNYVANIDFGKKKGREHYHAIVQCKNVDKSSWVKYGFIDVKSTYFDVSSNSVDKLSNYINKLTHHAIKETTRRNTLIYPKQIKKIS